MEVILREGSSPSSGIQQLSGTLAMTKEELKALLTQDEDGFLERKESAHHSDIRDSIVAFANAVPFGREAVVFVGQRSDKKIVGVPNVDKLQRDVKDWAKQCYPPVEVRPEVVSSEQGQVLALVIPFSPKKPHFTGKAYKRVGSQTVEASEEMLDDMIASRNEKAGRLLAHKGELIHVEFEFRSRGWDDLGTPFGSGATQKKPIHLRHEECIIESA